MSNTYRAVYIQIVFAVKNRKALLDKSWRSNLFAYTATAINNRGHYSLAVNGSFDHVHIFLDYSTNELIGDLVREIKKTMINFIKDNNLCPVKFEWHSGYGVFTHGYREKSMIINYIQRQEEHHSKRTFKNEYLSLLNSFEIEFKNEYIFEFLIRIDLLCGSLGDRSAVGYIRIAFGQHMLPMMPPCH